MRTSRFPAPDHDHEACLDRSMERAREAYRRRGGRLTELRETVLHQLAEGHHALGAYDIMRRLTERGRPVAPISVYRALDSLAEAGLIHRLESRNAYVACHASHDAQRPILFLVCDGCGAVAEAEAPELLRAVRSAAATAGFSLSGSVLEASGLCSHCAAG